MKIKSRLEKIIILLLLGAVTGIKVFGQDSYIKNRWNIKAGYTRYKTGSYIGNNEETTGNYRIEVNYGFSNYIETGAYFGGSRFEYYQPIDSMSFIPKGYFVPFYGGNCNFHLLPFLIDKENFRFDLYITGKFGGFVIKDKRSGDSFHRVEYALGTGACFYLWKHVGLYSEYCYGNYLFSEDSFIAHTKFRYGLTLKF